MKLIDSISPAPKDAWEGALRADPLALETQSPAWIEAMCAAGGFEDASRLYETEEGRILILPALRRRLLGGLAVEGSNPAHCGVGGVVAAGGATPDEIADSVLFIASDRARFISGQLLCVDGGYSAGKLAVVGPHIAAYYGTPGGWDVVVLTHVLEHLPDPVGALVKIRGLLKPGGVGVLEFPNIDALDARVRRFLDRTGMHRHRHAPTYKPGHVQEFCRASFALACARAGLKLLVWETYAVNPLKYALYRRWRIGNKARVLVRS